MIKKYTPQMVGIKILINDIHRMIDEARSAVAVTINTGLTLLHWHIGKRINKEILDGGRAKYGKQILATLSQELSREYGKGFNYSALTRMIRFAEVFPQKEIVATLSQQLSWSHFVILVNLKEPIQSEFYAEICRIERWNVRTLRKKVDSMLYERTAISRKPANLAQKELAQLREKGNMSPDLVFRDPYVLDFLNLKDTFSEADLEKAILWEIEKFLLELGCGFTFVARQKRMIIDSEDYYLDLLLFHRKLKRLVAVELKLGKFKAAYKGQMELYLRWLESNEMESDERTPLGIILCAEGGKQTIELLQLDESGIHVAEYMTELPPRIELKKKLHAAIEYAKNRAEKSSELESNGTSHE
jgi:predicted nuclease of restriction endonuclease-like (RecB) superfamily